MISPFCLITYRSYLEEQAQLWKETQETPHKGIPSGFSISQEWSVNINTILSTSEADLRYSIYHERELSQ